MLLTMCFALAMAMLDNTVVNVALPSVQSSLHASVSELQWIVDGYVLAFASLLLTGGILGDRYGRKLMFLSGLISRLSKKPAVYLQKFYTEFGTETRNNIEKAELVFFKYLKDVQERTA